MYQFQIFIAYKYDNGCDARSFQIMYVQKVFE